VRVLDVLHLGWLNLRRDRTALALTFVLPLLFFSIFAAVFGGLDQGGAAPVEAVVVVEDPGELARRFARAVAASPELRTVGGDEPTRERALELLRAGRASVAVVIPAGFGASFGGVGVGAGVGPGGGEAGVEVLADLSNPVALHRTVAELQSAALRLGYQLGTGGAPAPAAELPPGPLAVTVEDVLGGEGKKPSIAFFAAGIGVLFLLFAVSGRAALLIEERESGVLTRMLASRLRLSELLLGRWLFLTLLGFAQVTVMFLWGAAVFGLDLFAPGRPTSFAVLTAVTAAAAAGFGLLLATACTTRAQLGGVAAVVILVMSALGGSLFPRFLMPEGLQRLGLLTFNAWALDGYQKIFWYEAPLADLAPQLGVLATLTALFLAAARLLARRWQHR